MSNIIFFSPVFGFLAGIFLRSFIGIPKEILWILGASAVFLVVISLFLKILKSYDRRILGFLAFGLFFLFSIIGI